MAQGVGFFPGRGEMSELLKRDPCYPKISPGEPEPLVEFAWQAGTRAAEEFWLRHRGEELEPFGEFLSREGVTLLREDRDFVSGDTRYFAEIQPKRRRIRLYGGAVALWAREKGCPCQRAETLILMHEYFHFLEATKLGYLSQRVQVPLVRIFGCPLGRTGMGALSEIGANAFAAFLEERLREKEEQKAPAGDRREAAGQEEQDGTAL